ncbi:carbonic anhydrase [Alloacidobacterium dinghuense]|uniref:Carbonic anhydrase n=1 Tax=Alloacidobacterium dinghuense TaxID=2763107 RepID=A0A7G8BID2_9BACT|nr:carbonic anhydrase [Alloacidobacterium dinghuense]QNI32302.1 carbonic anhydrase [Alloacidobacterium dinghuense]
MKHLVHGYLRFRKDVFPQRKDNFHLLAERQAPDVLFITCADSRVVPDLILQTEPGDLFICRNAGNVVPPFGEAAGGVSATVEYAVEVLKVKHVILCGHSDCGAVKAVLDKKDMSRLPMTSKWLKYVEATWQYREPGDPIGDKKAQHTALIHANIVAQLHNLKTHPEIAAGLAKETLQVHGWYYDIMSGAIEVYDQHARRFGPLEDSI